MDQSVFEDILLQIEEADCRSLERFTKRTEADLERDELVGVIEAYILELFDNAALATLVQVRDPKDLRCYVASLKRWCEDVLPQHERDVLQGDLRKLAGLAPLRVDPGKLAGRIAHWRAEAIAKARSAPSGGVSRPKSMNGGGTDRRARVDAYIEEVFKKTGKRITRTDIWKEAKYKTRTEFERWERNDPKATEAANGAFNRVLTEMPHLK